jgi:hypothetical protein
MLEFRYTEHDDIEIESVPLTVQVTDLKHPLFGKTYPIVSLATPHGRNWLAMEMPCGSIRVIPHESTNLNHETIEFEALQQLPRISVPLMLNLQELLQRQMQKKEYGDGENTQETGENIPKDPNALAPIDAATTRADSCSCAADSASVASTHPASGGGK